VFGLKVGVLNLHGDWQLLAYISLDYACCSCIRASISICTFVYKHCHRRMSHAVLVYTHRTCIQRSRTDMSCLRGPATCLCRLGLHTVASLAYSLDHPYNDPYYHHHRISFLSLSSGGLNSTFLSHLEARLFPASAANSPESTFISLAGCSIFHHPSFAQHY
jgi:hypothetical protein